MDVTISKAAVKSMLDFSRKAYPKEFFAYLRGNASRGRVTIERIYYHPAVSSKKDVALLPSMETNIHGVIGTAHSHPNGHLHPSKADLQTFSSFPVNIITDREQFRVFDKEGKEVPFKLKEMPDAGDDMDRIHTEIYFEALRERKDWGSARQNAFFMALSAALMILLILVLSLRF